MGSPFELSTVFTDDFMFFEANHERCPHEAAIVFEFVSGLRTALQEFRESALPTICESAEPALLSSVDADVTA
jgi:hypothetical protein